MLDQIYKLFTGLYDFLVSIPAWILEQVLAVLGYMVDLFFMVAGFMLEQVLALITLPASLLGGAANMAGLPPTGVYLLTHIGLAEIMAMIGTAYLIRFSLNLIPSWATRV